MRSGRLGLGVVAALCGVGAACASPVWHVPGSACRWVLTPGQETVASDTGYARLWPCGAAFSNGHVRVFDDTGRERGVTVLWQADGDPLKVLFDSSGGAARWFAYPGLPPAGAAIAWRPMAGVTVETRARAEGAADSESAIRALCSASRPVLGRSLVPAIFEGLHAHGPTRDFVAIFDGWFTVKDGGAYGFATVSDDASLLAVDGHTVVTWPGWHGAHEGRFASHNGAVTLRPGRHRITYLNVQNGEGYSVAAAWKRPGEDRFSIMPREAFDPVLRADALACEAAPGTDAGPAFAWDPVEHSIVDGLSFVTVVFRVAEPGRRGAEYTWRFDDGATASGLKVRHVFMKPGLRRVVCERSAAAADTAPPVAATARVHVEPRWTQKEEWPESVYRQQSAELCAAPLDRAPTADLVQAFRVADRVDDTALLSRVSDALLARRAEAGTADRAWLFYRMGFRLQTPPLPRYAAAETAFRIASDASGASSNVVEGARLHLAGLYIHALGRVAEGEALLREVSDGGLGEPERRLRTIFQADALLSQGHVEAARRAYQSAGTTVDPSDRQYAIRRRARIETARDYLRRGEYDAAEKIVREIEWETPLERLGTETGLVLAGAQRGRGELALALAECRRMLNGAEADAARPEVLFELGETCRRMGRRDELRDVQRELQAAHPYSEAAARAKSAWRGEAAGGDVP